MVKYNCLKDTEAVIAKKEDGRLQIEYSKEAAKHIKMLDKPTKSRMKQAIEKLPSGDVRKLTGFENDYRLRVGSYRVLFSKSEDIIIIKDALPRGKAYKRL